MNRAGRVARGAIGLLGILWALGSPATTAPASVTVRPRTSLQEVIDAAPPKTRIVLTRGIHRGPIEVRTPVTLVGPRSAVITAPRDAEAALAVRAPDVTVSGMTVRGGWTGIALERAPDALLSRVLVTGAEAEGIRVYVAPARIEEVEVRDLKSEHGQGIEVLSAPDTVVTGSRVVGGKVGIVGHLSEVSIDGNRVTGTTEAGIMIREMSKGSARGNVVVDAAGAGLYCGDQSRCAFADNRVERIGPASEARSSAGWGLVVHFYSTASTHRGSLDGAAGDVAVLSSSRLSEHSALELGHGWRTVVPAAVAVLFALALLALIFGALRRWGPTIESRVTRDSARFGRAAVAVLVAGLAIQSFHMTEHFLQVFRVEWDGVPSRGGIVGSIVETEWVHFVYNALVLAGIAGLLWMRRRGWRPRLPQVGDAFLMAGGLVQGYHVIEHSAKVLQHIATGAKVNPGIAGHHVDLVWLHFVVNLVVYAAFAAACVVYLRVPAESRHLVKASSSSSPPRGGGFSSSHVARFLSSRITHS